MAPFDVHRNRGHHASIIPFPLVVQSRRWDFMRSRLLAPPFDAHKFAVLDGRATPLQVVDGMSLMLHALLMFTRPPRDLGTFVTRLADTDSDLVNAAIDEAISRAYG